MSGERNNVGSRERAGGGRWIHLVNFLTFLLYPIAFPCSFETNPNLQQVELKSTSIFIFLVCLLL